MRKRNSLLCVLAVCAGLAVPLTLRAQQVVGVSLPLSSFNSYTGNNVNTFVTPFAATQSGFITSWEAQFDPGVYSGICYPPIGMQLKVLRPTAPNVLTVVSAGNVFDPLALLQARFGATGCPSFVTNDPSSVLQFTEPASLQILAGDIIGLTVTGNPAAPPNTLAYLLPMASSGSNTRVVLQNVPVGGTIDLSNPITGTLPGLVNAVQVPVGGVPVFVSTPAGQILRVDGTTGATSVLLTESSGYSLSGLAVGPDDLIYAADLAGGRIIRIDQSGGNFLTVYDPSTTEASPVPPAEPEGPNFSTTGQLTFNTKGSTGVWQIGFDSSDNPGIPAQLIAPGGEPIGEGTTFNLADEVLFVENDVVRQQTAPGGNTATTIIANSPGNTYLSAPIGVAVNSSGSIFVSNFGSGKIAQFTSGGAYVNTYATFTAPDAPTFMQFDASGNLYVVTAQDLSGTNGKVWCVPAVASGQTSTPVLLVDLQSTYNLGHNLIGLSSGTAMGLALPATTYTTPPQPVSPGTLTTFSNGNIISETVLLPPDAVMGGTASKAVSFIEVPPAVFGATRLPGTTQSPNWSDGITPIPATTTCTIIAGTGGNCVVIRDLCFDSKNNPILPCYITAPTTPIQLTAHYKTQASPSCPAYVIADDDQPNWANITTSYNTADPTISGRTKTLNTDTTVVDLGAGNCATSDTTPPTTAAITSPPAPNGANGWFTTSPVTVILTSTDDALVKEIDYSINGVPQPTVPSASTLFQIANQGATTISYHATDEFNLVETPKLLGVKIDTTPPSIGITSPRNNATYGANQVVLANYSCTDTVPGVNRVSGVATCAGPVASGSRIDTSPTGVGLTPKTFTVTSSDMAGNPATSTVNYQVSCHYVSIGFNPSSVSPGAITIVTAKLMSCVSTAKTVFVAFALEGPLRPNACSSAESLMFTTPSFTLWPNVQQTVSFPFFVPKRTCAGTYNVVVTTKSKSGVALDTSSASLTVKQR